MNKDDIVVFEAMLHAESLNTNSFCCLVEKGEFGGWSNKQWFGTKYCSFEPYGETTSIVKVSAPFWLMQGKNIISLITKV